MTEPSDRLRFAIIAIETAAEKLGVSTTSLVNRLQKHDLIKGRLWEYKIIDTVDAYMDGFITSKQALGMLKVHTPNNQIAIINQEIADNHLKFVHSYQL